MQKCSGICLGEGSTPVPNERAWNAPQGGKRKRGEAFTKTMMYEGRSINKLQNGAIQLILKLGKAKIYVLWGILFLALDVSFVKMTSLWRHL